MTIRFWVISYIALMSLAGTASGSVSEFRSSRDTVRAGVYFRKALAYERQAIFDSSIHFYDLAGSDYLRARDYRNYLKCRNSIITASRKRIPTDSLLRDAFKYLDFSVKKAGNTDLVTGDCYNIIGNLYSDDRNLDSALIFFRKALTIWKIPVSTDYMRIATALRNFGTVYSSKGLLDSSDHYISQSVDLRKKYATNLPADLAPDYNILGINAYYRSEWDTCEFYFGKIVFIRERTVGTNHPLTAEAYNNLAALFMEKEMYDTALVLNKKALEIRTAVLPASHPNVALSLNNIGNTYMALGNYEASLQYHTRALEIRRLLYPRSDHPDIAMSYTNLGVICLDMGKYKEALEYFNQSLNILQKVFGHENTNTANAFNNIGAAYQYLGEYDKSYKYLNEAFEIRKKKGYAGGISTSLNNIGAVFKNKGDYDLALSYYRKSLEVLKSLNDNSLLSSVASKYSNIGEVFLLKGKADSALYYFNKALKIDSLVSGADSPDLAGDYLNRGAAYGELKDYDREIEDYKKGVKINLGTFGMIHPTTANFFSDISMNLIEKGIRDSALYYGSLSLKIKKKIYPSKHPEIASAFRDMAWLYEKAGMTDSSRTELINSLNAAYLSKFDPDSINPSLIIYEPEFTISLLDLCRLNNFEYQSKRNIRLLKDNVVYYSIVESLIQKTISGYLLEETKIDLLNKFAGSGIYAIDAAFKLYNLTGDIFYFQKALHFSDIGKSSVLHNLVIQNTIRNSDQKIDSMLITRNNLLGYTNYLQMKLHDKDFTDNFPEKEVRNKFDSTLIRIGILNDSINSCFSSSGSFRQDDGSTLFNKVRAALDNRSALISYSSYDSVLYTMVVMKESVFLHKQETRPVGQLGQLVGNYLSDLRKYVRNDFPGKSNKIYNLVFGNIRNRLKGVDKIIIIPDKYLLSLPFETLCRSAHVTESFSDFTDLPFLIRDYDISYHYSARLWSDSIETETRPVNEMLAVAPVFSELRATGSAGRDSNQERNLGELPFSLVELDSLISLCNRFRIRVDTLILSNATEKNIRNNITSYRFIHLATHQISNLADNQYSGLVFSDYRPDQKSDIFSAGSNDGVIYPRELYNIRLSADLVTLSACETGTGKIEEGEGMIGLVRGFLSTGARGVLYSYWKVGDRNSMIFMKDFYRYVFSGLDYPAALRQTKLKMINNPETAYPLIWGAYSFIGRTQVYR